MTSTAIILLIIASFTHAGWNFLSKKQHPTLAFFFCAAVVGFLIFLTPLTYFADKIPLISPTVWGLVVLTGIFQAGYFAALAGAYRAGDISLAYPIARASPIIVVMAVSFLLGQGDTITRQCIVGVVLVVLGGALLPMQAFRDFRLSNYWNRCCLLAFAAAFGTAGYTITDDYALQLLQQIPPPALSQTTGTLLYAGLENASTAFWLGVLVLTKAPGRKDIGALWTHSRSRTIITGIGIYGTYFLVLLAMHYVNNVSYVAAFRQLSVPLGALMGIVLLGEPRHPPKYVGLAILVGGLILVALG